jgi:5-methylcytosine-specific restriction protein A
MPSVPKQTKCKELGCNNPHSKRNGYCLQHGGKDKVDYQFNTTKDRKDFNAMYNTRQWQTLRQTQLSKHPICCGCKSEGIITPATVVDHIFPWRHYGLSLIHI